MQPEKEYERRFYEMLEKAEIIVVQLDHHGNITYCNKFTADLLEWDKDELIGKNWFDTCIKGSERKELKEVLDKIIELNGDLFPHHQNSIISKSGKEYVIKWDNLTLKDVNGRTIGTNSIGQDITAIVKANTELKKKVDELKALNEMMMGREERIIELKDELNKLKGK